MWRVDPPAVRALVESRLAHAGGEYLVFAPQGPLPRPRRSLESFAAEVRRERELHPVDDLGTTASATRAAADEAFLRLQSYDCDHVSSARWRACLAAHDGPLRWIDLARELEHDGRVVEANVAIAAARWLEPAAVENAVAEIVAARSPELPARVRDQPSRTFRTLGFPERHRAAWHMKIHPLVDIPSLIEHACDPNFAVRARIYRSLGQSAHPASIQTLHEGTLDPHPFARAQAVRSLGRICDPTLLARLDVLSADDPDPEVRRTAAKALQGIVGFWLHYGEWSAIFGDPARCLEVARSLAARGLPAMAHAVVMEVDYHARTPAHDVLERELEPHALLREVGAPSWRYSALSEEAAAADREIRHEPSLEEIARATDEPGVVGWEARRMMRCRGTGTIDQRRYHHALGWP